MITSVHKAEQSTYGMRVSSWNEQFREMSVNRDQTWDMYVNSGPIVNSDKRVNI